MIFGQLRTAVDALMQLHRQHPADGREDATGGEKGGQRKGAFLIHADTGAGFRASAPAAEPAPQDAAETAIAPPGVIGAAVFVFGDGATGGTEKGVQHQGVLGWMASLAAWMISRRALIASIAAAATADGDGGPSP